MKSLTGITQGFQKCTKVTLHINSFAERLPMIVSALEHHNDITLEKIAPKV